MNKYIYTIGAFTLALAVSGLPAVALAENNGDEGFGDDGARVGVQTQRADDQTKVVRSGESGEVSGQKLEEQKNSQGLGDQQNVQLGTTSQSVRVRPQIKGGDDERQEINLGLEEEVEEAPATSFDDLNQKIEVRKHQLEQEVASTTLANQNIVENANEVRLAVHTLLSSKDLLGGIGQQVSEIAKDMDRTVTTTTNAEAKIQSRGFLTRLIFGGDKLSAGAIMDEVVKNQKHIDDVTTLIDQSNVSSDIRSTLSVQITALKDAQSRLQALAEKEQKKWGLLSWLF